MFKRIKETTPNNFDTCPNRTLVLRSRGASYTERDSKHDITAIICPRNPEGIDIGYRERMSKDSHMVAKELGCLACPYAKIHMELVLAITDTMAPDGTQETTRTYNYLQSTVNEHEAKTP